MNRLGIDLGGTKIEGILISETGDILARKRIPTRQQEGYKAILERIISLVRELSEIHPDDYTVGICTPGTLLRIQLAARADASGPTPINI